MNHVGLLQCVVIVQAMESGWWEFRKGAGEDRMANRAHTGGKLRDMVGQ